MLQATTPKEFGESPSTPSKSKLKFSFKFPGTKRTSPKAEKRSFTDDLASRANEATAVTPEAEQAYNILVAKTSNGHQYPHTHNNRDSHIEDEVGNS